MPAFAASLAFMDQYRGYLVAQGGLIKPGAKKKQGHVLQGGDDDGGVGWRCRVRELMIFYI